MRPELDISPPSIELQPSRPSGDAAAVLYFIEALGSVGGTLMSVGIFFFTAHRFHWGPGWNFALAAAQGVAYVPGALLSGKLAARVSPRRALVVLHACLGLIAGAGALASRALTHPAPVVAVLLGYTFTIALTWPMLEGLVAGGADARTMARRIGVYNLVWPATGAAAVAAEGMAIQYWPAGVFLVPAAAHLLAAGLALQGLRKGSESPGPFPAADQGGPFRWQMLRRYYRALTAAGGVANQPRSSAAQGDSVAMLNEKLPPAPHPGSAGHPQAAPELLRMRTRALWVSRLALPATYAVIYGLMPLMPSLPSVARFDARFQTLIGSTWLVARWLAFVALAASAWWHTRPGVMAAAAVAMLTAFLGITLAPSRLWGTATPPGLDLASVIVWQVVLGLALGVIYSGSLYFGMVLSHGSTEHGGYHEALIGLGWMLGPAAGAATQWLRPGDGTAGALAVGMVIGASVLAVAAASICVGRRD